MTEIGKLYMKLYKDANDHNRCSKDTAGLDGLSHFVAMKGSEYGSSKVKLFVVGRAVNGWNGLNCGTKEAFAEEADSRFRSEGFRWIADEGECFEELHNIPADGEKPYYLSKSAFWRTTNKIWSGLSETNGGRFTDHIAWSNLYKIAPYEKGNPTTTMCRKQFEACRDILDAEIKAYEPTHILIITGYKNWFADKNYRGSQKACDFSAIFKGPKLQLSGKPQFVEGIEVYDLGGRLIPAVITYRPDRRDIKIKEKPFADEVIKTFSDLQEQITRLD